MNSYSASARDIRQPATQDELLSILRCPETREPLHRASERELETLSGRRWAFKDGIASFVTGNADYNVANVLRFCEANGWRDAEGFVGGRSVTLDHERRCIARLNRYFRRGGRYLLDAGSGSIAHRELLQYSAAYERRVCVDLSLPALRGAQAKLGERGIYVQGDLTNLPIATGSMDAVTCNHVLYQIPAEQQAAAFLELWRVLKPGGVAVAVYWWPGAPLAARFEALTECLGMHGAPDATEDEAYKPFEYCHSLQWFTEQDWPFRYRVESYCIVDSWFMRRRVSADWRGELLRNILCAMQRLAPEFSGRNGAVPAIIIYKD